MCKYTCLSCKNYKPTETKVVGRKLECNGMISVPVYKEIPEHCDKHPRYFKKWWKENGPKKRDECTQPKCLELIDSIKALDEMIILTNEILDELEKLEKDDNK
jgi:hypothetical protein